MATTHPFSAPVYQQLSRCIQSIIVINYCYYYDVLKKRNKKKYGLTRSSCRTVWRTSMTRPFLITEVGSLLRNCSTVNLGPAQYLYHSTMSNITNTDLQQLVKTYGTLYYLHNHKIQNLHRTRAEVSSLVTSDGCSPVTAGVTFNRLFHQPTKYII